jgi:hypothetical protein
MPYQPQRRAVVFASLSILAAAAPVAAQNLLANSHFHGNIAGWERDFGAGATDWSPLDVAGQSGSGSLRYTNTVTAPDAAVGSFHCVPVEGGVGYDAAAEYFIPAGQSRSGLAYIAISFHESTDCAGPSLAGSAGLPGAETPGGWVHVFSAAAFAQPNARSARVALVVVKNEAGGSFVAHADNVYLGREGTIPDCGPNATTLCLQGGRFRVTASWKTAAGATGAGQAVPLTAETGYFWFFGAANVEMVLKVIDACVAPYDRYWVFASGLTNVFVRLDVTDTLTGAQRVYENPQGRSFQPILDTSAFATCP